MKNQRLAQNTPKHGVSAIILNHKKEVLIVQRPSGLWEFPGGLVDERSEKDPEDQLIWQIWNDHSLHVVTLSQFATITAISETNESYSTELFVFELLNGVALKNTQAITDLAWERLKVFSKNKYWKTYVCKAQLEQCAKYPEMIPGTTSLK